jgi:hypothetical protein
MELKESDNHTAHVHVCQDGMLCLEFGEPTLRVEFPREEALRIARMIYAAHLGKPSRETEVQ